MTPCPRHVTRWGALALAALLTCAPGAAVRATAAPGGTGPTAATSAGLYVVTLTDRPTAVHPATRPASGERFDRTRAQVRSRSQRLLARQGEVLASVGEPEVVYRFTTAVNGFAARLDEQQVKRLRRMPEVTLVERSLTRPVQGDATGFLGLDGADGAWAGLGGVEDAGRGTVVGLVDTGIWPDNPSFAGLPQERPGRAAGLPGFHGACGAGEQWSTDDCSDKIVSARWFVRGFGADRLASSEPLSPRDSTGHGSHAASTAAGEPQVRAVVDGQRFPAQTGVAPAARIAVYKACWTAPDPEDDGCTTADAVAAVDQAVADGVDVLGYAVAGSADPVDSLGQAFLGAASAGVFVAAAAGNTGPGTGTVGNTSPWVTTVAAGTHLARQGAVVTSGGRAIVGAMLADEAVGPSRLVAGRDAAASGASSIEAAWCRPGSLDAALVQDAVVACDRGGVPRTDKSAAVAQAGGRGMVLLNTRAGSLEADVHAVPTVHLAVDDSRRLTAYLRQAGADAEVTLDPDAASEVTVPQVAAFSGRGPVPGEALLKPDLTAPGVGVVGASAPTGGSGRLWDLRSGTSVSSAHVAGLAALLRGRFPAWSAARVKSAMMTTGYDLPGSAGPFARGAGHVDPTAFTDPGLVLDSGPAAWRRYARGELAGADLNLPSLAVDGLVRPRTVIRRLTNVGRATETYTAAVEGLAGVAVRVRPTVLTLRPGQTRSVRITLTPTNDSRTGEHSPGSLTWTGLAHRVGVPVVVRTASVAAPARLSGSGSAGTIRLRARSASGRLVGVESGGLVPASPVGLSLPPGPFDIDDPRADDDTFVSDLHVPAGTDAVRVELDAVSSRDDVDLYVFHGETLVEAATGGSERARVTLLDPAPGDYTVYVHAVAAGNGSVTTSRLSTWVVPAEGGTPVDLTPTLTPSRPGGVLGYDVSWSGLDPTQSWLGVLRYEGSDRRTLLQVS